MKNQHYYKNNESLWNAKTAVHKESDFYELAAFKKGKSSLKATELAELGDIKGKTILHLQCHFGLDSLSLAREGAKVTGIDFSKDAIVLAKELNEELGLDATFIQTNVYDLPKILDQKFDIVFTSYGVLCWLGDLNGWASIVNQYMKPKGLFYIVELHPTLMLFEFESGNLKVKYPYFANKEPMEETLEGTYADESASIGHKEYFWNHPLGSIVTALIQQNLEIEYVHEFPFSHWNCFPNMVEKGKDEWHIKDFEKLLPLMYSIKAKKV